MAELDIKIISLILNDNKILLRDIESDLFEYPYNIIFTLLKKMYNKYGKLPTLDVIIKKLTLSKIIEKYFKDKESQDKYLNIVITLTDKHNDLDNLDIYLDELKLRKAKEIIKNKMVELKDVLVEYDKNSLKNKLYDIIKEVDTIDKGKENIIYTDNSNIEVVLDGIKEYYQKKVNNITTGFSVLDEETGGMSGGEMWLFAGRPGTGKSIALLNTAVHCIKKGKNVVIFSLEMPYTQYWIRFLSNYADIRTKNLYKDMLDEQEKVKLNTAIDQLKNMQNKLAIIDSPLITISDIKIELDKLSFNPDLIIIDYIGLIKDNNQSGKKPDYIILGEIAEGVRAIARNMNIPILTASQLNRSSDKSKGKLKSTERIARSDIISATCDVIVQLDESEKDKKEEKVEEENLLNIIEMYVAKNRKGRGFFSFHVRKNFEYSKFNEVPTLLF